LTLLVHITAEDLAKRIARNRITPMRGLVRAFPILLLGLLVGGPLAMAQPVNDDAQSGQLVFSASLGRNDRPFTLILLDLKSSSQQLLADYSNGNSAVAPAWSPDGRSLLYSLNRDCDGVYLYDVEGGRNERLDQPTEHGGGCQAAWSPDGRYIAYMSNRESTSPGFYYDLYTFDLRTRTHRRLTKKSGGYPIWSPDGEWIIYYAPARDARTYRIRLDGSGDELFPKLADQRLRAKGFTWSPDGKRMAFTAWILQRDGLTADGDQVYTADIAGRDIRLLTPETWVHASPVWSARQDRIGLLVSAKDEYGTASIRLVEGGQSREAVAQTYWEFDSYNFWSPNGRAIAYAPMHGRTFEGRGICVLNLDDGTIRRFATEMLAAYPVWRPIRR
jgi:Tol biopolymer transport system component